MKRFLFSLIACFCFVSTNSQVLNLYLKGGVLPINTYEIDSIRLVPEQELPSYDVKGILTSSEEGWVCIGCDINNSYNYNVYNFLVDGFVSVQNFLINSNDSLSFESMNLYSFSISSTNKLLLSNDDQYSEYILTDIEEDIIAFACYNSSNNSTFPQYMVLERNHYGIPEAIHSHLIANIGDYYLYHLSSEGLCIGKSIQSIKDLDPSINWLSSSISFNPTKAPLFSNQKNQYRLHVENLHYDETTKEYRDREGTIALGFNPYRHLMETYSFFKDSLVLELCSPKVQEAINHLEYLHQEYFPSQSKFYYSFGRSGEMGTEKRTGFLITSRTTRTYITIAVSGGYSDSFNFSIRLLKDENGNYDWSANYDAYANKGMGDALNEVVSLFEGEFRKEPAYLTSTPGYFKLISTSDPDIYFTWYIR